MKFYAISTFIHILLIGSLFIEKQVHQHSEPSVIELISLPSQSVARPSGRPSPIYKAKKKKIVKKTLKSVSKNNIKDSFMEEETDNSADTQRMALTYKEELNLFLQQNKRYPRRALKLRQSGVVQIKVMITPNGEFRNVRVVSKSRFETLDKAAKKLLTQLGRFKPLPKGYRGSTEFIIPVAYQLKGSQSL